VASGAHVLVFLVLQEAEGHRERETEIIAGPFLTGGLPVMAVANDIHEDFLEGLPEAGKLFASAADKCHFIDVQFHYIGIHFHFLLFPLLFTDIMISFFVLCEGSDGVFHLL
jgi:hypothetical protein